MTLAQKSIARVVSVLLSVGIGFLVLQNAVRQVEIRAYCNLVRVLGAGRTGIPVIQGTIAVIDPRHQAPFAIILTPSCSALPAILAIGTLATCMSGFNRPRLILGTSLAIGVAILGNMARIDLAVVIGLIWGRVSLVLFHDWVGSVFNFAAVLVGWIILLRLQLPKGGESIDDIVTSTMPDPRLDATSGEWRQRTLPSPGGLK